MVVLRARPVASFLPLRRRIRRPRERPCLPPRARRARSRGPPVYVPLTLRADAPPSVRGPSRPWGLRTRRARGGGSAAARRHARPSPGGEAFFFLGVSALLWPTRRERYRALDRAAELGQPPYADAAPFFAAKAELRIGRLAKPARARRPRGGTRRFRGRGPHLLDRWMPPSGRHEAVVGASSCWPWSRPRPARSDRCGASSTRPGRSIERDRSKAARRLFETALGEARATGALTEQSQALAAGEGRAQAATTARRARLDEALPLAQAAAIAGRWHGPDGMGTVAWYQDAEAARLLLLAGHRGLRGGGGPEGAANGIANLLLTLGVDGGRERAGSRGAAPRAQTGNPASWTLPSRRRRRPRHTRLRGRAALSWRRGRRFAERRSARRRSRRSNSLGYLHRMYGRDDQALVFQREALALARSLGDPHTIVQSLAGVGVALHGLERKQEAAAAFEDGSASRGPRNSKRWVPMMQENLAAIELDRGRLTRASELDALALAARPGVPREADMLLVKAAILRQRGRWSGALGETEKAVAAARSHDDAQALPLALAMRARCLEAVGRRRKHSPPRGRRSTCWNGSVAAWTPTTRCGRARRAHARSLRGGGRRAAPPGPVGGGARGVHAGARARLPRPAGRGAAIPARATPAPPSPTCVRWRDGWTRRCSSTSRRERGVRVGREPAGTLTSVRLPRCRARAHVAAAQGAVLYGRAPDAAHGARWRRAAAASCSWDARSEHWRQLYDLVIAPVRRACRAAPTRG